MKILLKDILIMVPNSSGVIKSERLQRIIGSTPLARSIAVRLGAKYNTFRDGKLFHSRIERIDVSEYVGPSSRPDLNVIIVAVDVLEHLTKHEGTQLLGKMEQWARRKVIVTTPNGYLSQDVYDSNPLQEHRSGWSVEELRELGLKVYGINGWKALKGYKALPKCRPALLWLAVSQMSQKITYYYPKLAFQLLAVKRIRSEDRV